jgi:hypothetical protein
MSARDAADCNFQPRPICVNESFLQEENLEGGYFSGFASPLR